MAPQTVRASATGIAKAERLRQELGWTQEDLAGKSLASRQVVIRFLGGKPVRLDLFKLICKALSPESDWKEFEAFEEIQSSSPLPSSESVLIDGSKIESLVQRLREQTSAGIEQRCGLMRILDMTTPIDSGAIYTAVNILERITSKTRRELDELMDCGSEEFDRFLIGKVREKRVDGLEAVLDKKQLMILGRPGAGKTTFLKRLAMLCRSGDFLADQVPIFVTLKEWAESPGQPGLLEFVGRYFSGAIDSVQAVLTFGRGLVLLDGLDEVLEKDHDRVLTEIGNFSQTYKDNQIVITCRIAAREYIFQQFTEVEVADFSDEQIQEFANKWFLVKEPANTDDEGKSKVGKLFWNALQEREPVKELATNPLLLTLLCLEFENSAEFPRGRAELYERGLYLLLSKWDGQRRIQRESAYGKLSVKRKESLLGQLAIATFERGDYFFKEHVAERQIGDYIQNLPEAKTDSAALLVDSRKVLRDMVAQHGLLTERARGIYSFSHLTFHEYFSARSIVDSSNPVKYELAISRLMEHVADKRWCEVFLLVVERSDDAGYVLTRMKQTVDSILLGDEVLQSFLVWVNLKSTNNRKTEQPLAVRFFYYLLDRARGRALDLGLDLARTLGLDLDRGRALDLALACALDLDLDLDLARGRVRALDRARAKALDHALALDRALDRARAFDDRELEHKLQQLQNQLPNTKGDLKQWWSQNGNAWGDYLQAVMIEHRNIGHDWNFSEAQQSLLEQYYVANQLLSDCLKSECYADRKVLQHIEDTMLLPMAEIEKRAQT
jgi:predicted NACHT family NTPase